MAGGRKVRRLNKLADAVPFWWHSIDLGDGVVTSGRKSQAQLQQEWAALQLPDLSGRTVLDVGAWDGWFSFEAERRGAARVVALDRYVWSLDVARQQQYWAECRQNGTVPQPYHLVPELWHPDTLPGKVGFDTAHRALDSKVESVVGDFMTMDLDRLGTFDVVLFLGVIAQVRHPLLALERLARVTREVLVVETDAVAIPGFEHHGFCEFFEANELNGDVNNWWAPNQRALVGMCRAAGFPRVETNKDGRSRPPGMEALHRYRLVVRAWTGPSQPEEGLFPPG